MNQGLTALGTVFPNPCGHLVSLKVRKETNICGVHSAYYLNETCLGAQATPHPPPHHAAEGSWVAQPFSLDITNHSQKNCQAYKDAKIRPGQISEPGAAGMLALSEHKLAVTVNMLRSLADGS